MSNLSTNNSNRPDWYERTGIPQIPVSSAKEAVLACMRTGLVSILIGPAGSGKTDMMSQIAKEIDAFLLHLFVAHLGSEEVKGLLFRSLENSETYKILANEQIWNAVKLAESGKPVIIFLDELNRASDYDTLNAIFSMISKRGMPGIKFPDNLYLVAAGNPPTGNFQVQEMEDDAFVRRLVWMGVSVSPSSWLKWAKTNGIHESVTNYIQANPQRLYDEDLTNQGRPHPNPATWASISKILKDHEENGTAIFTLRLLLSGMVGQAIAMGFLEYYKSSALLLSPLEILDQKWSLSKKKLDAQKKESRHDLMAELTTSMVLHLKTEMPVLVASQTKNLVEFLCYLEEDHQSLFSTELSSKGSDAEFEQYTKTLTTKLQKFEKFRALTDKLKQLQEG